jgi:hypothetical protein
MERSAIRMSRGQWIAGCLVILAAIVGAAVSTPWSERIFARPESLAETGDATHTRTCITLSGKKFEWNFPNPPFGTLSCSE